MPTCGRMHSHTRAHTLHTHLHAHTHAHTTHAHECNRVTRVNGDGGGGGGGDDGGVRTVRLRLSAGPTVSPVALVAASPSWVC